jgi:hypothetical protein
MYNFFIVSSDMSTYAQTTKEAALAAGAKAWDWNHLRTAIAQLDVGDELSVDRDVSVIRISGKDIDYVKRTATVQTA